MFKSIDMPTGDTLVRQAFLKLVRTIQTDVEHKHIQNSTAIDMEKGDILSLAGGGDAGDRPGILAVNGSRAEALWSCVLSEPVEAGAWGVGRTGGYALVKLVDTDVPTDSEGTYVYVSDVPGQGTITEPVGPAWVNIVGLLADATEFDAADNPFVWVFLHKCCAPSEGIVL